MRRLFQVFEHGTLRIGDSGFKEPEFNALVKFNQRHGSGYFTVGHKALMFRSYVGVIQVGALTIEILPKADKGADGDKGKWRNALFNMLRECGYLKLASISRADLRLRRASLFDLYMEAFLDEVRALLNQGLVKKYRQAEANVPALKGRLKFSRHLTENLIHRERFYTVHNHYDRDNVFNSILKCALQVVCSVARSTNLQREAKGLIECFDHAPSKQITMETFSRLRYDRNTERYRYAIALARLIILNYQPDVRAGRDDVLAILFDMNKLFETYVFKQLRRAVRQLDRNDIDVSAQRFKPFWRSPHSSRGLLPDILIRWGDGGPSTSMILDTKWKIPKTGHPDDTDLKQMYAYNLQFGSQRSYLLYPHIPGKSDIDGRYVPSTILDVNNHQCGMWFLELFDGDELRPDLGEEILERVLQQ